MAVTQTTITGPVYLPDSGVLNEGKIIFELSSWDREEGEAVFVSGPYVATLDEYSDFSTTIFTSEEGENDVVYRVSVSYKDPTGKYQNNYLGTIALSGPGPYKLSDLEFVTEWTANSFDVLAKGSDLQLAQRRQSAALQSGRIAARVGDQGGTENGYQPGGDQAGLC